MIALGELRATQLHQHLAGFGVIGAERLFVQFHRTREMGGRPRVVAVIAAGRIVHLTEPDRIVH